MSFFEQIYMKNDRNEYIIEDISDISFDVLIKRRDIFLDDRKYFELIINEFYLSFFRLKRDFENDLLKLLQNMSENKEYILKENNLSFFPIKYRIRFNNSKFCFIEISTIYKEIFFDKIEVTNGDKNQTFESVNIKNKWRSDICYIINIKSIKLYKKNLVLVFDCTSEDTFLHIQEVNYDDKCIINTLNIFKIHFSIQKFKTLIIKVYSESQLIQIYNNLKIMDSENKEDNIDFYYTSETTCKSRLLLSFVYTTIEGKKSCINLFYDVQFLSPVICNVNFLDNFFAEDIQRKNQKFLNIDFENIYDGEIIICCEDNKEFILYPGEEYSLFVNANDLVNVGSLSFKFYNSEKKYTLINSVHLSRVLDCEYNIKPMKPSRKKCFSLVISLQNKSNNDYEYATSIEIQNSEFCLKGNNQYRTGKLKKNSETKVKYNIVYNTKFNRGSIYFCNVRIKFFNMEKTITYNSRLSVIV